MFMLGLDARYAVNIPTGILGFVWGYLDNATPWQPADWDRFSGVPRLSIATQAKTENADAYDVEQYALDPSEVPGVLLRERIKNREPIIYSNASGLSQVASACQSQGQALPKYGWLADVNHGEFVVGQRLYGIMVTAQQFDWGRNVDITIADIAWLSSAQGNTGSEKLSLGDISNLALQQVYGGTVAGMTVTRLPDNENPKRRHFDISLV